MIDEKVYYPETIEENPFPGGDLPVIASQSLSAGTFAPAIAKEKTFPKKRSAIELLSTALNTRSKKILQKFEFTPSGAIQIGTFDNGVSGDIKIAPTGIVARNTAGLNTIVIDGDTGDVTIAGTLQSGSVIAGALLTGLIEVGNDSIVIDGDDRRITMTDSAGDIRILIGDDGT